jgi:hypothetical protein
VHERRPGRAGRGGDTRVPGRVGRACVLARVAAARLGRRARGRLEARGTRVRTARVRPRGRASTRCSCAGADRPEGEAAPGRAQGPTAARRATQEPLAAASCGGAAGVAPGDTSLATRCSRLQEFGAPSSSKKRRNPFSEKQHTKYSCNQILLSPGLDSAVDSEFGGSSASAERSPSCSRE